MPFLDVTDVLSDPDFCDYTLVCIRNHQAKDADGFVTKDEFVHSVDTKKPPVGGL